MTPSKLQTGTTSFQGVSVRSWGQAAAPRNRAHDYFRPNTESFITATAGGSRPQKPPLFVGTVKAEAGQPIQYAMDADDYRSYRAALAEGP